jgi:hypothetical protein
MNSELDGARGGGNSPRFFSRAFAALLAAALLCAAAPTTQSGEPPPGGRTLQEVLADSPGWSHADREPDPAGVERLSRVEAGWAVEVAYGAWCSDSAREVPRFLALLKRLEAKAPGVRWIAVNRAKSEPAAEIRRLRIERVPTFVVTRGGRETGRIVERAEPSIEEALLRILDPAAASARP